MWGPFFLGSPVVNKRFEFVLLLLVEQSWMSNIKSTSLKIILLWDARNVAKTHGKLSFNVERYPFLV